MAILNSLSRTQLLVFITPMDYPRWLKKHQQARERKESHVKVVIESAVKVVPTAIFLQPTRPNITCLLLSPRLAPEYYH